jgi:hypothetical protein
MSVSDFPVEDDPEAPAKPRRSRLKGGPIKPGQYLLNRVQVKELCGDPSDSTLWGWMMHAGFPHPLEMGPQGRADHQGELDRF